MATCHSIVQTHKRGYNPVGYLNLSTAPSLSGAVDQQYRSRPQERIEGGAGTCGDKSSVWATAFESADTALYAINRREVLGFVSDPSGSITCISSFYGVKPSGGATAFAKKRGSDQP